jgi:hypothetical protein
VWRQQAKLLPADGAAGDYFGASVALDGETTVIGARYDDDNGEDSGSSYVFTGVGRVWTEQKKLLPADGAAGDRYGLSVAFDGDAAIIGAPQDDDNGEGSGSAYLLARTGGLWTEEDKLLPVDGAIEDWFGLAVAVDGHTAFIGAPYDDDNGSSSGSAYVFRLCDHRITISTDAGDTLIFLTPDPGLFDLVAGNLSDLLIDEDFSHAVCLTPSTANPAVDPLPDPALGEGRYYLGRPLELCQTEGYGDSSLTPDPRDELAAGPCP